MNERIRELAEQAGLEFDNDLVLESKPIYYITQKELAKFAELIVKECAEVINDDIMYQVNQGVISNVFGLNQARDLIKQHFGVEE